MALSWFCQGCLADQEGEVPSNSKCKECSFAARKQVLTELAAFDQEINIDNLAERQQDVPEDFMRILNEDYKNLLA